MKTATRNLEEDHVHILRLIDVMETVNNILFRMADKALSESDQSDLLTKFEQEERGSTDYINQINELAAIYSLHT